MMRCKAELRIAVTGSNASLDLWPGVEVDVDRELAPGLTIAAAVMGRDSCFEDVRTDVQPPPEVGAAPRSEHSARTVRHGR